MRQGGRAVGPRTDRHGGRDDIYDERGRSLRYERLPDDNRMRKHGATTLGDALK
jgi:hypothetical protein